MTRGSGRKYSMRAWLGLFLLLVTHTVAQTTVLRKVAELQDATSNRNAVLRGVSSPLDSPDARDTKDTVPVHWEETFQDSSTGKEIEGFGNKITANNASTIESEKQTETKTKGEGTTIAYEFSEIPTIATIDFEKHVTKTSSPVVEGITTVDSLLSNETESTTTNFSEFGTDELVENVEESSVSELAEGTTPRAVKPASDRESETENRKHIETTVDAANTEDYTDVSVKLEVSLANDTNVNYNPDGTPKAVVIGSRNVTVDGELATNDPLAGSTVSDYGPKNEVEILKNVTHPATMKLTADTSGDDDAVRATTMIYVDPKPKARTILFSRTNNLATGSPKMDESLERSTTRVSGRTNERIEKPNDSLTTPPYPYAKNKIVEPESESRTTDKSETSVTKESTDENTIGRQKSVEKLIATESSALFENTIQQFKPVNPKRSGNFSRLSENVDATSTLITPTSSDLENLEGTERKETSSTLVKVARDNDIPRGNQRTSETTESGAVGSSVGLRDDGGDVTNGKGTENESFGTSTPEDTFFDGIVPSSTTDEATTLSSSTKRTVLREGSQTGIGEEETTLRGEMLPDGDISSTTIDLRDETTTLSTPIEDISQDDESSKATTESANERTQTVQYEFVGLTESPSSTTSDHYVSTSESRNSASSTVVEAPTTSFQDSPDTTEQISTKVPTEPNETRTILDGETSIPSDGVTASIDSTGTLDTTTIYDENSGTTLIGDQSDTPVSENGDTSTTSTYAETTLSLTPKNGISGRNVPEMTTIPISAVDVDATTAVDDSNGNTAASNVNGVPNTSVGTVHDTETFVDGTTIRSTNATETPEFPVSSEEISLFVKIIFEGSWSDLCPRLTSLRQIAASLLSQETETIVLERNIILYQTQCSKTNGTSTTTTTLLLYVVDNSGSFDYTSTELLASLMTSIINFSPTILSVEKFPIEMSESNNNAIAVVAVSSVAFICLVLLAGLLFIMRKRQTRFNYGERCRPVSLDAYSLDNVSTYNSVRRKGLARASKRSYGNPAFEDSSVTPSHPLNFAGLSTFCNDSTAINEEFSGIPQVSARIDELPAGAEVKNRYANVIPLPETRVPLQKINNEPLTEYINASYVRGPKNATKYYIACQAPIESTVSDFWRMIWEQQSKVIIMLTDIVENGVEKCVEYIPPSEVTDCHRLYGDYQVTLKKREAKEKYAISTLHLKNLETNTYREVSHIWYLWPTNGVPSDGSGLIAVLLEARALQRGGPGPIVIHCSPGTGRTGTLIALDLGIRQYEITRTIDVPRVVYTIRRDRAGAVQTKEQYGFIYKALNLYATKLAGGALESM